MTETEREQRAEKLYVSYAKDSAERMLEVVLDAVERDKQERRLIIICFTILGIAALIVNGLIIIIGRII